MCTSEEKKKKRREKIERLCNRLMEQKTGGVFTKEKKSDSRIIYAYARLPNGLQTKKRPPNDSRVYPLARAVLKNFAVFFTNSLVWFTRDIWTKCYF